MLDLAIFFKQTILDGLKSNTLTSCSRWASNRRMMPSLVDRALIEPYTWKYHPWVRDMHDSTASYNYAMKAAQLGVTECGINRAFFVLDQLKRDVLYVLPTSLTASDFSKARFSIALKHSPYLASIFTDTNTVGLKQAGTANLYIRGSRGDSNLVSIPVSELILDEVDRMDQKQVWLALERLSGNLRKSVWGISTPTIPNFGIHKLFMTGTQEHYCFRCPACSRLTELVWPDCIEIIGETVNDPRCQESFLKCKECKNKLHQEDKPNFLRADKATWQVMAPNNNPDVRSFSINQLYSFTITAGEIVVAYHRGLGDEAANKEFHNSKIGVPFIGDGAQITDDMIEQCIGNHTTNDARPRSGGERLITMGVDQGKTCYFTVCEWFIDKLSRDVNVAAMCKVRAFGKFFDNEWSRLDELMREWQVLACVIDADPETNDARRFAKKYAPYVYLCRYRRGKTAKEISISEEDTGAPIATVDRTNWLSATLGRFPSKRIILPRDVTLEYREMMKSLVRTYEKDDSGNPVATYVDVAPDHFAHSLNYAEIGLPLAAAITTNSDVEKFL